MPIHPSAIVSPDARIHPSAEIGPFCLIGPHVTIGAYCRLLSHVVIEQRTSLGEYNELHPFSVVGGIPQDKKYNGEPSRLSIGDRNVIREGVTIHIGTQLGGMQTTIGDDCLLMAYCHIAHDCHIGNEVILANNATLAGHVAIDDHVILGGLAAIQQFCHLGRHAFIAGGSMVTMDIPPFCIAQGDRAKLCGINKIGLKRHGWSNQEIRLIAQVFRMIYIDASTRAEGLSGAQLLLAPQHEAAAYFCDFIKQSQRGTAPARKMYEPELSYLEPAQGIFESNERV